MKLSIKFGGFIFFMYICFKTIKNDKENYSH